MLALIAAGLLSLPVAFAQNVSYLFQTVPYCPSAPSGPYPQLKTSVTSGGVTYKFLNFIDDSIIHPSYNPLVDTSLTAEQCTSACRGFPTFILTPHECLCAEGLSNLGPGTGEGLIACPGDVTEECGKYDFSTGAIFDAVYQYVSGVTPSIVTNVVGNCGRDVYRPEYEFDYEIGFGSNGRITDGELYTNDAMTPVLCAYYCGCNQTVASRTFAVSRGNTCECGDVISNQKNYGSLFHPCGGQAVEACGTVCGPGDNCASDGTNDDIAVSKRALGDDVGGLVYSILLPATSTSIQTSNGPTSIPVSTSISSASSAESSASSQGSTSGIPISSSISTATLTPSTGVSSETVTSAGSSVSSESQAPSSSIPSSSATSEPATSSSISELSSVSTAIATTASATSESESSASNPLTVTSSQTLTGSLSSSSSAQPSSTANVRYPCPRSDGKVFALPSDNDKFLINCNTAYLGGELESSVVPSFLDCLEFCEFYTPNPNQGGGKSCIAATFEESTSTCVLRYSITELLTNDPGFDSGKYYLYSPSASTAVLPSSTSRIATASGSVSSIVTTSAPSSSVAPSSVGSSSIPSSIERSSSETSSASAASLVSSSKTSSSKALSSQRSVASSSGVTASSSSVSSASETPTDSSILRSSTQTSPTGPESSASSASSTSAESQTKSRASSQKSVESSSSSPPVASSSSVLPSLSSFSSDVPSSSIAQSSSSQTTSPPSSSTTASPTTKSGSSRTINTTSYTPIFSEASCPGDDGTQETDALSGVYNVNCGAQVLGGNLPSLHADYFDACLSYCDMTDGCAAVSYLDGNESPPVNKNCVPYSSFSGYDTVGVTDSLYAAVSAFGPNSGSDYQDNLCTDPSYGNNTSYTDVFGVTYTLGCGATFSSDTQLASMAMDSIQGCLTYCSLYQTCIAVLFVGTGFPADGTDNCFPVSQYDRTQAASDVAFAIQQQD